MEQSAFTNGNDDEDKVYDVREFKTLEGFRATLGKGGYAVVIQVLHESEGEFAIKLMEPTGSAKKIEQSRKW